MNRYTPSNLAHQGAKIRGEKEQLEFVSWLEKLEYGELKIPRPSLVVYLDVDADVASVLVDQKDARNYLGDRRKDQHEADAGYQRRSSEMYRFLAERLDGWVTIKCMHDGAISSREAIAALVWDHVKTLL